MSDPACIDTASRPIHMAGAFAKTKKATNILRPAIDVTFDKDAEFKVFSEVGVQEVRFFPIFPSSAGGRVIKSRHLETKPLKFSPPKSLCGTVGSPWVSLATLFGFWETLIKFSESMILYGEKSFFRFFFFLARFKAGTKILHIGTKKIRR